MKWVTIEQFLSLFKTDGDSIDVEMCILNEPIALRENLSDQLYRQYRNITTNPLSVSLMRSINRGSTSTERVEDDLPRIA
jgi:hypothetical protein